MIDSETPPDPVPTAPGPGSPGSTLSRNDGTAPQPVSPSGAERALSTDHAAALPGDVTRRDAHSGPSTARAGGETASHEPGVGPWRRLRGGRIAARSAGRAERARLRLRRDPVTAGLLAAASFAVLAGLVGTGLSLRLAMLREADAIAARDRADAEADMAGQRLYDLSLILVQRAWSDGRPDRMHALLEEQRPQRPGQSDRRAFEWYYWRRLDAGMTTLPSDMGRITDIATRLSPPQVAAAGWWLDDGGQMEGEVRRWDLATGRVIGSLRKTSFRPIGLGYDPGGACLVLAEEDRLDTAAGKAGKTWRVRDVERGAAILELPEVPLRREETISPSLSAFRPDLQRLALGDRGSSPHDPGHIAVLDLRTGTLAPTLSEIDRPSSALRFSPDGRRLALIGAERGLAIHDVRDGHRILRVGDREATARFTTVAFHPDGRRLATADAVGTVQLWDLERKAVVATSRGHAIPAKERMLTPPDAVTDLAFSPDGGRLASSGADGTLRLWDATTGRELQVLRGHRATVSCLRFAPDGRRLLSTGDDGTVRIWDPDRLREMWTTRCDQGSLYGVAFRLDGQVMLACGRSRGVALLDARTGRVAGTLPVSPPDAPVRLVGTNPHVSLHPRGDELAAIRNEVDCVIRELATGRERITLPMSGGYAKEVVYSPDGTRIATCSSSLTEALDPTAVLEVWDARTGLRILARTATGEMTKSSSLIFSPDGQVVAWVLSSLGASEQSIEFVAVPSGRVLSAIHVDSEGINRLAFDPDGHRCAAGGQDEAVHLWEVATGRLQVVLRGHNGGVYAVAFSPDGRRLASAGGEGVIKLWDLRTGQEILSLAVGAGPARWLAFSRDGHRLVACGDRDMVYVWDADTTAGESEGIHLPMRMVVPGSGTTSVPIGRGEAGDIR